MVFALSPAHLGIPISPNPIPSPRLAACNQHTMAGLFGSLAESGASPRVPVDLQASFRGSKVCRLHSGPSSSKPERVCPFLLAALSAGVKLPPTHVEASARALEQLRQTQTVNSASPLPQPGCPALPYSITVV